MKSEIMKLRELAKKNMEIANKPVHKERADLWRKHNSFKGDRPLINVRNFPFDEVFGDILKCEDPLLRRCEEILYTNIFRDEIGYDYVLEPWYTMSAVYEPTTANRWGVKVELGEKPQEGGAAAFDPVLTEEEDIEKLVMPRHKVNEEATKRNYEKLADAIGDIMPIYVKRSSIFYMWTGDISTDIAKMRGLEQIMWDVYDRPEWFHRLLTFMRDAILKVHEDAEKAGDFSLADHENQSIPFAEELRDPDPEVKGVKRKELWWYMASQEYTTFGPDMFYEFLLQYQIPILEKFGLASYGCCEDLTYKIDYLRKIPNLRRIAVTPFANAKKCAEQIGKDYILSWRPDPSSNLSTGLDEDYVRKYMREHFQIFKENGNHFDITLKDVMTVNHQPEKLKRWIQIVREEIDRTFGS